MTVGRGSPLPAVGKSNLDRRARSDTPLQFDGTDAGKRFIEAWKRARVIVDTGGGHSSTTTPPAPTPAPAATPHP